MTGVITDGSPWFRRAVDYSLAMSPTKITDKKTIAEQTANMYLDIGAVRFMARQAVYLHLGLGEPGL